MPTAALLAAGAIQGGAQIMGGFQQQAESKNEAKILEQQGQVESTNAYGEIAANDVKTAQVGGTVTANAAASGVRGTSGSVSAVRNMNESMGILRDTYARYKGDVAKQNAYYQARSARYQGNQAMWGGLLSGGTTLLTSGAMAKYMSGGTGSPSGSP